MRKIAPALISLLLIPILSNCQTIAKVANEAFVITRMAYKFHVEPRPVNTLFSENVYNGMLERTDYDRLIFTKEDIEG
jgi:hypothetical protein